MLNEYLNQVKNLEPDLNKVYELMKIDTVREQINEYESKFAHEGWSDVKSFQEYNKLLSQLERWVKLFNRYYELLELIELAIEDNAGEEVLEDIIHEELIVRSEIQKTKIESMFIGKYDDNNAILTLHAGSGGKEAQDWASMLLRMYQRWANGNDLKCEIIDWIEGEFPGSVKSATIEVKGEHAFGLLKNEAGVHRLIRVSPFDSQNRRHTSFAAVEVIPEVEMNTEINIDPKDIQMDVFRASGAGGQHVNKTSSAVRLTHIPTGIVVSCQQERSQHQNKDYAMKILVSKLMAIKEKEHYAEISDIKGEQRQIEWGSQIRSYIFMPYQLVKDHRTGCETGNIEAVMNGDINEFIYKSLAE